ncbi:hypothetical protein M2302_004957 [Micromonospora sp. A200]|uniref:hypothetical protein n=1 Tax=Micromonospora sp. A200 TaxID=2940568 RepID=UPI00247523B8|nr:hypothetical protein [Micromonospora sp. A200]MDH6464756.1 hypothetical protein [Micromonospora sp. A200]
MIHVVPVRRPYPLLAAAIVLVLLGAGVAWGGGDALGLSHTPAAVPREDVAAAPQRVAAPAPPLASMVVPDEPRTIKAAAAVADALVARGLPRPVVNPAVPGRTPPARTATTAQPAAGTRSTAGPATGTRSTSPSRSRRSAGSSWPPPWCCATGTVCGAAAPSG